MIRKTIIGVLAVFMLSVFSVFSVCAEEADTLFINGRIYTVDKNFSTVEAVAVKDGVIIFTGTTAEAAAYKGGNTKVVNLKGQMMLPGFTDAHMHPAMSAVVYMYEVSLHNIYDTRSYLSAIKSFVKKNPDNEWYLGGGFNRAMYDNVGPRKEALDAISPDKPVAIRSVDGHSLWANSKALELAGITKDTPNPEGGVIQKDPVTGEPAGLLQESAMDLVASLQPEYSRAQYKEAILWLQSWFNSVGLTNIFDAYVSLDNEDYYMAYQELAEEGKLTIRFRGGWFMDPEKDYKEQISKGVELSKKFKTEYWQVNTFKFFLDQVIEEETGLLKEAYANNPENFGIKVWKDEVIKNAFAMIDKAGFQIHCHQIGDAAAEYGLKALEYAREKNGKRDWRPSFAHIQLMDEAEQIKAAELGLTTIVAPYWMASDDYYWELNLPYLGEERASNMYPYRSLIEKGINTAIHSDFFVTEPDFMWAFYGAQTRNIPTRIYKEWYGPDPAYKRIVDPAKELKRTSRVMEIGPLKPQKEAVSLKDVIKSATINGAWTNYLDGIAGSIEIGKKADFVIIQKNLFDMSVEKQANAKIKMVYFEGKRVF